MSGSIRTGPCTVLDLLLLFICTLRRGTRNTGSETPIVSVQTIGERGRFGGPDQHSISSSDYCSTVGAASLNGTASITLMNFRL